MSNPRNIATGTGSVTTHTDIGVSEIPQVGASGWSGRAEALSSRLSATWHEFRREERRFSESLGGDFLAGVCFFMLCFALIFARPFLQAVVIVGGFDGY